MSARVHVIEERAGRWRRLVMEAAPGNVLSIAMVRAIDAALDEVERAGGLRWLTLEGGGAEFSFGASLHEHLPEPMRAVLPETHRLFRRWLTLPVPTASLVEGRCLGGGFELALCCDDILSDGDAVFGLPEIKVGALPPLGSLLLPLRVGASRAARAVITGDFQTAGYWHDAGLLSLAAPGRTVIDSARDWFDTRLARHSSVALGEAALASRAVVRAQVEPLLDVMERRYLETILATADAEEGVRAWIEKRAPVWRDQ